MTSIKLTDAKIKNLKAQEKVYRILDADRLYIEVRPSGKKIWRLKFTLQGKESSMSLGEYPSISLADARVLRDEMRAKLAKNIQPVTDRKEARKKESEATLNTFKNIAEEYINERISSKSETYQRHFRDCMRIDIYGVIGDKNIRDITSADVLKIMRDSILRIKKQKNHGSGEVTAIHNRKYIGAVMRYAIATLRADNDPTYAVRNVIERPPVQHAKPLTRDERFVVRTKLDSYGGTETVKNAGFLLLYTMLRSIEIRRMRWEWVDFDNKVINFPKSSMKKGRDHVLPISSQVLHVLKAQYLNSGNDVYVFPAVYKSNEMLSKTTLNRMLQYIGLSGVTSHDFRATASTLLYERGYEEDWIEKQLAHAETNKTKASYDHSKHLAQRAKMLQDWADIVDSWKN